MSEHWPSIADPGVVCSCGFKVAGVTFAEAKRRWREHALADAWDEGYDEGADDTFGTRDANPYRARRPLEGLRDVAPEDEADEWRLRR